MGWFLTWSCLPMFVSGQSHVWVDPVVTAICVVITDVSCIYLAHTQHHALGSSAVKSLLNEGCCGITPGTEESDGTHEEAAKKSAVAYASTEHKVTRRLE